MSCIELIDMLGTQDPVLARNKTLFTKRRGCLPVRILFLPMLAPCLAPCKGRRSNRIPKAPVSTGQENRFLTVIPASSARLRLLMLNASAPTLSR
jgi:hypothetical protein